MRGSRRGEPLEHLCRDISRAATNAAHCAQAQDSRNRNAPVQGREAGVNALRMSRVALERLEIALELELVARNGLHEFVRLAWHQVEPVKFVDGWHLHELCRHLEAVSRGEIRRLLINIPPGCGKSLIVSVIWPVWDWIARPDRKWMYASFDAALSQRDALRARQLVESDWFRQRWTVRIDDSAEVQRTMTVYHTTAGGFRFSSSVGGRATGWHAHIQVVDDPIKPQEVQESPEKARGALDGAWNWWQNTMASRKADPQDFSRVIIMQRLHEDDLAGRCIREGGWVHLNLPMRYEADSPCRTPIGGDQRAEEGELLWPERYNADAVVQTEKDMGSRVAAAQLQQRPSPAGGLIFERKWLLKEWRELPANAQLIQSWDCTFKDVSTSDYVVGQVWAYAKARYYLVDQVRGRMNLPATCQAIRDMSRKHPTAILKLIEDKANGPAVEQTLKDELSDIVMINPEGGKIARANAAAPAFEAGNVYVPEASPETGWLSDWREEMANFPMGLNDDQVDATTQAINYLRTNSWAQYEQMLENVAEEIRR